jgi:hypothetical protein
MVKVGDIVKWNAGKQGMLSGKVTGGEKGKRWRIESKGKRYYVPKEDVKKGAVKRAKKAPAPAKKAEPKKTPAPDKDTLQKVMGIMAEVAKEKGKSTKKEVDEKVAMDKKAREGKLKFQDFSDVIFDDSEMREVVFSHENEMEEVQGYNMDYWLSRVSKRADTWNDLTTKQSERLKEIMMNDITRQTNKKMRAFWNKNVKGKKIKSMKELKNLFDKEYYGTEY